MWRRPRRAIWLLLALLPLHTLAMALVFHFLHPSHRLLGAFEGWKDLVVGAALLRACTAPDAWLGQHLHVLDAAVGLMGAVALLSVPLHHRLGMAGDLLALRTDFMLVPFYALGRLARAGPQARRLMLVVTACTGLAATTVGVAERFIDPIPLLRAIDLPGFERFAYNLVFLSPYGLPYNYFQANFARRVGSFFLSAVGLATWGGLTVAAGAGLLRTAGSLRSRQGILAQAALAAGVTAPVLAAGRLDLAMAPLLLALTLLLTRRWIPVVAAGGLLVVLVAVFNVTFYGQRYAHMPPSLAAPRPAAAVRGTPPATPSQRRRPVATPLVVSGDQSLALHLRSIRTSASAALRHPMGQGMGAAGLSAARNQGQGGEGQVYTLAVDLGVPGLIALALLLVAGAVTAWRAARSGPEPDFGVATLLMVVVVAVTTPVAEVFTNLAAMAVWCCCLGQLVRYARATASAPGATRVLLDLTCTRTAQAGVRRYAEGLRLGLRELSPEIQVVEVAAPVPRYRRGESPLRKLVRHALLLVWFQAGLPLAAAARRASLLVCPEYYCPWLAPCPRVVVFHDTLFWDRDEYPGWWRALLGWTALGPARHGASVVTPSATQVPRLASLLGRPEQAISCLPPVIAPAPTLQEGDAGDAIGDLQPGYLLHVGALERRKEIPRVIEAYGLSRRDAAPWPPLVLAGPRSPIAALDDHAAITEAIRARGLEESVRVLGRVPDHRIAALFQGAGALLFAGRAEGFGIPLAEAMAAGVPVVAVGSPTTSEVVGEAGLLVAPGDPEAFANAIERVVTSGSLRASLRARGLERAERYRPAAAAARLRAVVRQALRSPFHLRPAGEQPVTG